MKNNKTTSLLEELLEKKKRQRIVTIYKMLAAAQNHSAQEVYDQYKNISKDITKSKRKFHRTLSYCHNRFKSQDNQIKSGQLKPFLYDYLLLETANYYIVYDPTAKGIHTEDIYNLLKTIYGNEYECPSKTEITRTLNDAQFLPQCDRKLLTINGVKRRGIEHCKIVIMQQPPKPVTDQQKFKEKYQNADYTELLGKAQETEFSLYHHMNWTFIFGAPYGIDENLQYEGVYIYSKNPANFVRDYSFEFLEKIFLQNEREHLVNSLSNISLEDKKDNINKDSEDNNFIRNNSNSFVFELNTRGKVFPQQNQIDIDVEKNESEKQSTSAESNNIVSTMYNINQINYNIISKINNDKVKEEQRMSIGLTKERMQEFLNQKLMWSDVEGFADSVNEHAFFYTENSDNKEEKQFHYKCMTKYLSWLYLYRIPFHYDDEGKIYVKREEIQDKMFPKEAEDLLEEIRNLQAEIDEIQEDRAMRDVKDYAQKPKKVIELEEQIEKMMQKLDSMGFKTFNKSLLVLLPKGVDHQASLFDAIREIEEKKQ